MKLALCGQPGPLNIIEYMSGLGNLAKDVTLGSLCVGGSKRACVPGFQMKHTLSTQLEQL